MFKSRQFIIGLIVSVLFFALALRDIHLDQVWQALLEAEYWVLIPALVLYFVGVWFRSLRWRILLRPILPRITLRRTFEVEVIGYMANDILPARIGELVRAYVLSLTEGVRKTATLATILVERIFDGITMVGFAAAAILWVVLRDPDALETGPGHQFGTLISNMSVPLMVTTALFLGAIVVFLVVASSPRLMERLATFFFRFLPDRFRQRANRLLISFIEGLQSMRSPTSMLAVLGFSVVAWLFEAGMYYVIGTWGFDLRGTDGQLLPFYVYMLATAGINLATLIPQGPGFIGVFEAVAMAVLVGGFGVVRDPALSYVLVLHAALLIPVTLLGFYYMARESMSYRDLVKLEETRAEAAEEAHELEGPLTDIELAQEGIIGGSEAEEQLEEAGERRK
ncbi:MAG TPA: lysylphosphatidylglycerol synthase transmembrane domain-containing protein [Chloroflexia bacterium]|nr:lysylphosphatidylglycerol synthase transmembrane domain-containing protein [Chloroflexia bacterium]